MIGPFFGVMCLAGYFVMLSNADKIRSSKYWFLWWLLGMLLLVMSVPAINVIFDIGRLLVS